MSDVEDEYVDEEEQEDEEEQSEAVSTFLIPQLGHQ